MKIIKISQFEDEGNDIEESTERDTFESMTELNDSQLGKEGTVYTAELLNELTTNTDRINSAYVADGAVAWVQFKDKIYEITVSPAAKGKYLNFFQEMQNSEWLHKQPKTT